MHLEKLKMLYGKDVEETPGRAAIKIDVDTITIITSNDTIFNIDNYFDHKVFDFGGTEVIRVEYTSYPYIRYKYINTKASKSIDIDCMLRYNEPQNGVIYELTTTGEIRILDIDNMDYYCISTCGAVIYGSRYFCVDDDNIKTTLVSKEKSEDKLAEHTIKINRYSKYVELENINWEVSVVSS